MSPRCQRSICRVNEIFDSQNNKKNQVLGISSSIEGNKLVKLYKKSQTVKVKLSKLHKLNCPISNRYFYNN